MRASEWEIPAEILATWKTRLHGKSAVRAWRAEAIERARWCEQT